MEAAAEAVEQPTVTDEQLVARFQAGDQSAFDALVARHQRPTYRLAYRLMGAHGDADDLAQEAFLRAYQALGAFRGEARFRTWLTRIVVNLALNARQARRLVPLEQTAEPHAPGTEGPEAALRHQVRRAVGTLPRRQRQILMLKVYEEMKFTEIAEATGVSVGTAKATFFQAVQALKSRLLAPVRPGGEGEFHS